MEQTPAVVTPLDDHMGLDIARSLGRRGIPIYAIDPDPHACGRYSKYCHFIQSPSPSSHEGADYIDFLMKIGQRLGKPILFPLSDEYVLLCSRRRDDLQKYFHYVMPCADVIENLATKAGLKCIAEANNIPAPHTAFVTDLESLQAIANRFNFPVILKPTESMAWHDPKIVRLLRNGLLRGSAKVVLCNTPQELIEAYKCISGFDGRLVVQEVIPGEDSRLVYISFYLDRESKPLGMFAGRKYRVLPTGFGSASFVRSFYDPRLKDAALKILSATNYCGLVGVEFKQDPRDGEYKLIEVNTRFGMWDGLGAHCGVDLAYIAYCDALGMHIEPQLNYRENVIWLDWQRDFRAALEYWREGRLSAKDWLLSLRGEKILAVYSRDDWLPGVAFTFGLFDKFVTRLFQH